MKEKHFINIITCLLYIPVMICNSYSIFVYLEHDTLLCVLSPVIFWIATLLIAIVLDSFNICIKVPYASNYKSNVISPSYSLERGGLSYWVIVKHELGWGSSKEYIWLPLLNIFKFRGLWEVDRLHFNGELDDLEDLETYYENKTKTIRAEYEKETEEHNKTKNKLKELNSKYNNNLKR